MALVLNLDLVTPDQARQVKKALLVTPITPIFKTRGRPQFARKTPDPVIAYTVASDEAGAKALRLPFTFGANFFRQSNDKRIFPRVSFKMVPPLYDYQKIIVREVIGDLNKCRCATIMVRPGKGKTRMSVAVSSHIGLIPCVVLPINLCAQWKKEFEDCCPGIAVWVVGESYPPGGKFDVIVCLVTRTKTIPEDIRCQIGLLILDEAHKFCNQTGISAILDFGPRYILACTATYARSRDQMHRVMDAVVGLKRITMVNDKMDFNVFKYETGIVAERVMNKQGTVDWTTLIQSLLYSPERNEMIFEVVGKLLNAGRKIMLLTSEVKHVDMLYAMFSTRGIVCDFRSRKKRSYNDSSMLISNVQLSGTGFDEASFCEDFRGRRINCVLQVTSIASPELIEQMVGRGMRSSSLIYTYMLDNDPTCKKHWDRCAKPWCLSNDAKIHDIKRAEVYFKPDGTKEIVKDTMFDKLLGVIGNGDDGPAKQIIKTEGKNISGLPGVPELEFPTEATSSSSEPKVAAGSSTATPDLEFPFEFED